MGELAVRDEFPDATIVRPSVIYGEWDRFIRPLLSRFRRMPTGFIWIYGAGEKTFKMPIFVSFFKK